MRGGYWVLFILALALAAQLLLGTLGDSDERVTSELGEIKELLIQQNAKSDRMIALLEELIKQNAKVLERLERLEALHVSGNATENVTANVTGEQIPQWAFSP